MATQKQRKAVKNLVENGGNVSKAMIQADYSPATAKTPQKLTESKGFQELVEEYLSDMDLMQVHREGLKAVKKTVIDGQVNADPDYAVRHKYLETGYKIKGMLGRESSPITAIQVNVKQDRDEFR